MHDDEIERALRSDPGLTPSPGFTGRVMVSVRHAAREREALAFPWGRLSAGLAACAVVTVAAPLLGPRPELRELSRAAADLQLVSAAPWLATALVLAFLPSWWSLRLASRPN